MISVTINEPMGQMLQTESLSVLKFAQELCITSNAVTILIAQKIYTT